METKPKYSLVEVERRWLVELSALGELSAFPYRDVEDLYLTGTRLRLRRMTDPLHGPTFKLAKKYGKASAMSEALTNLYLTEAEYEMLSVLPGRRVAKRRYSLEGGALDVYVHPNRGLAIFEVEFKGEDSARLYRPPSFTTREVTAEEAFSGASLAGRNAV